MLTPPYARVASAGARQAGRHGGVVHFGFRLVDPVPVTRLVKAIKGAGGRILGKGEFAPGLPFVSFEDPDGYEVEVRYETPTPLDPPKETGR